MPVQIKVCQVHLARSFGSILSLDFRANFLPDVFISWESASPPKAWFALAVQAGQAITGETPQSLHDAIEKCYHDALKDKSELSSVELPKSKIECQAFTRDGGAVSMTITVDDGKDRDPPEEVK
jgi:hypothetical protein